MSNEHTSKELSERLDKLGFKGEHARSYEVRHYAGAGDKVKLVLAQFDGYNDAWKYFPTYTFTELWGKLPNDIRPSDEVREYLKILDEDVRVGYYCADSASWLGHRTFKHKSPAEAAGLMMIWLIENGHVEVSK